MEVNEKYSHEEQRKRVIAEAGRMFFEQGIRKVRMDDVAAALTMSKRTLYEMFGDKEELLYQSLVYLMQQHRRCMSQSVADCENILEVLLRSVRLLGSYGRVKDMEKRLATNLKKFYPNVYNKIKRDHAEQGLAGLRYALDRCMAEGYLDPTVDIELMARLFLSTSGTLLSEDNIVIPDEVSREEAFGAMVVNFLRGLASEKGLKVIDELLAREPRPLKLSERRKMNNN